MFFPRRQRDERGAVMVEGAIAIPTFLLIVFFGIDLIRIVFLYVGLQFITTNAVRDASMISNVDQSNGVYSSSDHESTANGSFLDIQGRERAQQIEQAIRASGRNYGVNLSDENMTSISICHESGPQYRSCAGLHAGFPNELFKVQVVHNVYSLFGNIEFPLRAEVIGKNEMQIPVD